MKNNILERDLEFICKSSNVDFSNFEGKTVLVTGATGVIGSNIVLALLRANVGLKNPIKIIAFVRDMQKANLIFKNSENKPNYIINDVTHKIDIEGSIDYIIHAASQTSSKLFVAEPVETIETAIYGTVNMLKLAREKNVSGFVYLSTMEVYGFPETDEKITEDHGTNLNTMVVRSCYPESKRICESLCSSYVAEYGVPAKIARLTQTFGPGVSYNDGRIFADFVRCAIEKRNIVLHTKGETKRNYLYTADAVTAILTVLLSGRIGEAYNAANEDTYCSIYEMAELFAKVCANNEIKVIIKEEDTSKFGYAPVLKMNLDTNKLRDLGWAPTTNLNNMVRDLYDYMRQLKNCMIL